MCDIWEKKGTLIWTWNKSHCVAREEDWISGFILFLVISMCTTIAKFHARAMTSHFHAEWKRGSRNLPVKQAAKRDNILEERSFS